MGLKFLQKKKWHPLTIENLEAVWLAEQKHKEQKTMLKEHGKRIEEERKEEELKRAQVKAGLISEADLNKMTWMYDVPSVAQNKPSNTMEDFFNNEAEEQNQEDEEERRRREAKEQKDRILWWVMNNTTDVKKMLKEFKRSKDESTLNSDFIKMLEDIIDKQKSKKQKKLKKDKKRKDKKKK